MRRDLDTEFRQLSRTSSFGERLAELAGLARLLVESTDEESGRWEGERERLQRVAEVVPMDAGVLRAAAGHRAAFEFQPHDAIVYASVLSHLDRSGDAPSCFLNADARDFDDPDVVAELALASHRLPRR